jgi:hypothetical protein
MDRLMLLILLIFVLMSGNNNISLEIKQLDIRESDGALSSLLTKVARYERENHDGDDDIIYHVSIFNKSASDLSFEENNQYQLFISGMDDAWKISEKYLKRYFGYVQIDNVIFLFSCPIHRNQKVISKYFNIKNYSRKFSFKPHEESNEIYEDNNDVIRLYCEAEIDSVKIHRIYCVNADGFIVTLQ